MDIQDILPFAFIVFIVFAIWGFKFWAQSYFRKKGEHFATKEDFNNLLEQTKKITEATENIKSELSHKNWHNQQHWALNEKHYTDILRHLTICKNSLLDRLEYYQEPGSEYNDSCSKTEPFIELSQKAQSSFSVLRELTGSASIFLSETSIDALKKLDNEHCGIANYSADCMKDYLQLTLEQVDKAFSAVLLEAKNLLGYVK